MRDCGHLKKNVHIVVSHTCNAHCLHTLSLAQERQPSHNIQMEIEGQLITQKWKTTTHADRFHSHHLKDEEHSVREIYVKKRHWDISCSSGNVYDIARKIVPSASLHQLVFSNSRQLHKTWSLFSYVIFHCFSTQSVAHWCSYYIHPGTTESDSKEEWWK